MIYILNEVELFLGREKDGRFGGLSVKATKNVSQN